jgi:hypothetical protein
MKKDIRKDKPFLGGDEFAVTLKVEELLRGERDGSGTRTGADQVAIGVAIVAMEV